MNERHAAPGILEVGFGTGLNYFLTQSYCQNINKSFSYESLEPYPIQSYLIKQINESAQLELDIDFLDSYEHWVESTEAIFCYERPSSELKIHRTRIQEFSSAELFDLIYFDAFSPSHQPEMWDEQIFQKISSFSKEYAVLVTYCARGYVKRTLKSLGWKVESLHGPPGKREMIRATFLGSSRLQ